MEIKQYTDETYVPIKDLISFGDEFVKETKNYRQTFMEMVPLNEIDFVSIVETPKLIKKRYSKNVEIKGLLGIELKSNDFILEIAKSIALKKPLIEIENQVLEKLLKKYQENNKDLTIITSYLIKNISKIIIKKEITGKNPLQLFPELKKTDIDFMYKCNNSELFFSINDYIDVANCSYEKARTSLEKLADLHFYQKTKISKKFVYKPTSKLLNIIQGGK